MTKEQMAQELAEREFGSMGNNDIIDILIHGCKGWLEIHDLKEQYKHITENDIYLGDSIR
jgi:hypothetical protein